MDSRRRRQAEGRTGNALDRASTGQRQGRAAEDLACRYLRTRGLKLLAANYRCRYGELDLIMCDGAQVVVVEVRSRRSDRHGAPEASLTRRKRLCLMPRRAMLHARQSAIQRYDAAL